MIKKLDIDIYRAIDKYEMILKINELVDEVNKGKDR